MTHSYGASDALAEQMADINKSLAKTWLTPGIQFKIETGASALNMSAMKNPALEGFRTMQQEFFQSARNPLHEQMKAFSQSNAFLQIQSQNQIELPNILANFTVPIDVSRITNLTYAPSSPVAEMMRQLNTDLRDRMHAAVREDRAPTPRELDDVIEALSEQVPEAVQSEFIDDVLTPSSVGVAEDLLADPDEDFLAEFEALAAEFDFDEQTTDLEVYLERTDITDRVRHTTGFESFRARFSGLTESKVAKLVGLCVLGLVLTAMICVLPPDAREFANSYLGVMGILLSFRSA